MIKESIYSEKIVLLKNQKLTSREFVEFGRKLGVVTEYYESMYHHREEKEIFVSSNIKAEVTDPVKDNHTVEGVPGTGAFWHSDYAFMQKPFAFTMTYPQVIPNERGTYFIDMADAYNQLSSELKELFDKATCKHSVCKYFKIRPQDVYKPIGAILKEIEQNTPVVTHPAVITHPVTQEKILYISDGFTLSMSGPLQGIDYAEALQQGLKASGQLDSSYSHPNIKFLEMQQNDIILWDNRRFVHHAKHSKVNVPTKTYRLTIYDEFPFSQKNNINEAIICE